MILINFYSDTFFIQVIFAYLYKRMPRGSSGAGGDRMSFVHLANFKQ